jgi:branched-chain amino acid transport system permease protein
LGRFLLPSFFKIFLNPSSATDIGSALSSMMIYILMAAVLIWKPSGLFGNNAK